MSSQQIGMLRINRKRAFRETKSSIVFYPFARTQQFIQCYLFNNTLSSKSFVLHYESSFDVYLTAPDTKVPIDARISGGSIPLNYYGDSRYYTLSLLAKDTIPEAEFMYDNLDQPLMVPTAAGASNGGGQFFILGGLGPTGYCVYRTLSSFTSLLLAPNPYIKVASEAFAQLERQRNADADGSIVRVKRLMPIFCVPQLGSSALNSTGTIKIVQNCLVLKNLTSEKQFFEPATTLTSVLVTNLLSTKFIIVLQDDELRTPKPAIISEICRITYDEDKSIEITIDNAAHLMIFRQKIKRNGTIITNEAAIEFSADFTQAPTLALTFSLSDINNKSSIQYYLDFGPIAKTTRATVNQPLEDFNVTNITVDLLGYSPALFVSAFIYGSPQTFASLDMIRRACNANVINQ